AGPRIELGHEADPACRAEHPGTDHSGQRCAELAAHALPARPRAHWRKLHRRALARPRSGRSRGCQVRSVPEGIPGDPRTVGHPPAGNLPLLLRLLLDHGLFYEFVPVTELDSPNPTRHWLGTLERGVNYAIVVSTCAGMWGHIIGDTVRFESLDPPLLSFTGRTRYTLSAFGEHLINEEVEAAMASASSASRASVRDWHVGPVFEGALG